MRSELYHKLNASFDRTGTDMVAALRQQIKTLTSMQGVEAAVELLRKQLIQEESRIAAGPSLTWEQAIEHLSKQSPIKMFIGDSTKLRYEESSLEPRQFAEMFLLREFVRRPRGGNSLETLGLVSIHFPALESLVPPADWANHGGDAKSWQNLLKLSIDYYVRANYCSEIDNKYRRWLGMRFAARTLVGPDSAEGPTNGRRWPTVNATQRSDQRLMTLIRLHLDLDAGVKHDDVVLDSVLRAAWKAIFGAGILSPSGDGGNVSFQLNFRKSELRLIDNAFVCPVTNRVLDTTMGGISPYHARDSLDQSKNMLKRLGKCLVLKMPKLAHPFGLNDTGSVMPPSEIQNWLESAESVSRVRDAGLWGEFSDRIAHVPIYFESAEHSGQISKNRLQELETRFRERKTNVLSCSTTMEMGIDIGGLTAVAMNNAPPGPANWLQRAGRAGRKGIAQASTLTLCGSLPHGRAVFENPAWPFRTPIHVPQVSLSSDRIVQRHVQSYLLARYFGTLKVDDAIKLDAQWMFCANESKSSYAEKFQVWLEDSAADDQSIVDAVDRITARSGLETESLRKLLDKCIAVISSIATTWRNADEVLVDELESVGGPPTAGVRPTPIQQAIAIQLVRHRGEFLLKELAQSGFLPAHGFPLDVLPFVTSSAESMAQDRKSRTDSSDRDDNRFRRNDFPSRQLPMAIREYAPGNSVVIDGLSYKSSGLTLNWKIPQSDEGFREPQVIRTYYQCKRCGYSKSDRSAPHACPSCEGDMFQAVRYIKPSGFAVDIRSGMPNSIDEQTSYVPPTDPRINCESNWISLPNPNIGSYRHDADGHVFHFSKGTNGHGYAICLRCGRAASESELAERKSPLNRGGHHIKLRTGNQKQNTDVCEGTDESFAVQRYIWLGGEEVTDVFQLRLKNLNGTDGGIDEVIAVPLAIALRNALAEFLGIDTREIGWAVQENRDQGFSFHDIYLYDNAAGGAGYVAAIGMFIEELLESARTQLKCTCKNACHNCLLSFDTQHHAKNLDRRPAYDFLGDSFFATFEVPESYRCFGDSTQWEAGTITEGVLRRLIKPGVQVIEIIADGSGNKWDIEAWKMWRHLTKLSTSDTGVKVRIVVRESVLQSLEWPVLNSIVTMAVGRNMEVMQIADCDMEKASGKLAARVHTADETIQWALFDDELLVPGSNWGVPASAQPTVRSRSNREPLLEGRICTLEQVKEKQPNNCKVKFVNRELDGQINSFGEIFWKETRKASGRLNDLMNKANPKKAFYTDRYLRSPLTARLLYELIAKCTNDSASLELDILTSWKRPDRPSSSIRSDWSEAITQKKCLEAIFASFKATIKNLDYRDLGHARKLVLSWEDGSSVMLVLDQGVGFMQDDGRVPFDLSLSPSKQARDLIGCKFTVRHDGRGMPIYIMNASS